ncbi:TonB-dependent receptor [Lacinutrix sp. Bg11-31]|uniref:TonB-dependent receptor n=1 Tax=Lacinutrix sp. Bg11-31 TaxID=2057808 RepID=UPI000C30A760|nr:TonB-dependent receptor [Lacinutrix sp. Bg11-31]AUC81316.1 TonB-dependent receptor [Lacinutrix sp. Bg11-31]
MKYLILVVAFMATNCVLAQQTITGKVTDNFTQEPLEDVTVYFAQLEKGTITNSEGLFNLSGLPEGNQTIIFSILGFETVSKTINLPLKGTLNIALNSSAIEMEELIISTPFHRLQSDNVMKVERESMSALKQNGAVTLADGITSIAGVESISTGLSIGKPVIRGLSSNRVLVYAQGVRLENQQFGGEHGLGINGSGIESVEIIKGPASLLYGSDAIGGVLYINPERFAVQNTSSADFNTNYYSNTKGYSTNVGYKSSSDNFKFLFRGSLAEHSDYKTEDYRVTNTRFREQDFKAGLGYQKEGFKTDFRYNVNHSKLGLPEEIGEQSTAKTPLLPYQDLTNHIFSSKSKVFFNNSSLDVNLGYTYNDRKEFEEHHDEEEHDEAHEDEVLAAALHMKLKTANYNIKYNLPTLGKFETIVGVQGMHQINSNYGEEQLIPDATTNDFGILATSHIHFNKVDVQLGARYDNRNINVIDGLNKEFNSINAAIGAKTNLTEKVVARLNIASGFRAPNLAELTSFGSHEGTNRFEIGNTNLKNEQNFQADLALEYKNEHVEVFANGFYNSINNYIYLTPNGTFINEDPVFNYLQQNANLYGGEFGLHFHPHPLDWLHFESSFETVTGKQDNGDYLPLIPANSLTNTIRVEFDKKWINKSYAFVKLKNTFQQNNVSNFETPTGSYTLLSAGFGGDFTVFNNRLSLSVSGNNLTNKTYINHLSRLKGDGVFNIGRNINVGLSYKI